MADTYLSTTKNDINFALRFLRKRRKDNGRLTTTDTRAMALSLLTLSSRAKKIFEIR